MAGDVVDCDDEVMKRFSKKNPSIRWHIACICGSSKFKDDMLAEAKRLTLNGHVVVMPHVFSHCGDEITDEQKVKLDDLHRRKIDMAESVVIVTRNGYIGESTRSEIEYAEKMNKDIYYEDYGEGKQ
mgnify:CR=1 FL=1